MQIPLYGISPKDIDGEGELRVEKTKQTTSELFANLYKKEFHLIREIAF